MARIDSHVVLGSADDGVDASYGALFRLLMIDAETDAIEQSTIGYIPRPGPHHTGWYVWVPQVPDDAQQPGTYFYGEWYTIPFPVKWQGPNTEHWELYDPTQAGLPPPSIVFFFDMGQPETITSWRALFADFVTSWGWPSHALDPWLPEGYPEPECNYPAHVPTTVRLYGCDVRDPTNRSQLTLADEHESETLVEGAVDIGPHRYWAVEVVAEQTFWPLQIKLFL